MSYVYPGLVEQSRKHTYTFVQKLGKGSFGETWEAKQDGKYKVAVKCFKMSRREQRYVDYYNIELTALNDLVDKGGCSEYAICYIDSYVNTNGYARIVMEFIDGPSLRDYMKQVRVSERAIKLDLAKQLVCAINDLHSKGIVHKDIKEENIMVETKYVNGAVKRKIRIIDWGLGCIKEKYCKQNGENCKYPCDHRSTPYITPPEFNDIDYIPDMPFSVAKAFDIWSAGVVIYDWYTAKDLDDQLKHRAFYKLKPEEIRARINKINDKSIQLILKNTLVTHPNMRLNSWGIVYRHVNIFDSVSKCKNPVNTDNIDEIISIRTSKCGEFWCFNRNDVLQNLDVYVSNGRFKNPVTGESISLEKLDSKLLKMLNIHITMKRGIDEYNNKYKNLVLGEDDGVVAAENFINELLQLPDIVKKCSNLEAEGITWDNFKAFIADETNVAKFLLPFFMRLTKENLNEIPKIHIDDDDFLTQLSLRVYFDVLSPVQIFATVFDIIDTHITKLLENGVVKYTTETFEKEKRKMLCDYLTALIVYTKELENTDLADFCEDMRQRWNSIFKKLNDEVDPIKLRKKVMENPFFKESRRTYIIRTLDRWYVDRDNMDLVNKFCNEQKL